MRVEHALQIFCPLTLCRAGRGDRDPVDQLLYPDENPINQQSVVGRDKDPGAACDHRGRGGRGAHPRRQGAALFMWADAVFGLGCRWRENASGGRGHHLRGCYQTLIRAPLQQAKPWRPFAALHSGSPCSLVRPSGLRAVSRLKDTLPERAKSFLPLRYYDCVAE